MRTRVVLAILGSSAVAVSCVAAQKLGQRDLAIQKYSELSTLWLEKELEGYDARPFIARMRDVEELVSQNRVGEAVSLMEASLKEAQALPTSKSAREPRPPPRPRPLSPPVHAKEREITISFYSRPDAAFQIARTYHVAQHEPGASNRNNGLFASHQGGENGPFRDFNAWSVRRKLDGPADGVRVVVHRGIYWIEDLGEGGIILRGQGDELHPIILSGAPGETAVIAPGRSLNTREPILIDGRHGIVEGLFIKRSGNKYNLLIVGKSAIVRNNVFEGPWFGDALKVGDQAEDCLIFNNDFSLHGSQAVDSFGNDILIKENQVHDDASGRGMGFGTKGGTRNHVYVGNTLHDLHGGLGGGGTGNLDRYRRDGEGNLLHAATDVVIVGNTLYNIGSEATSFQSCKNCSFEGNLVYDSFGGFRVGIAPDVFTGSFQDLAKGLPSDEGVTIRNNRFSNMTSGFFGLVEEHARKGFVSEGNMYYSDRAPMFALRGSKLHKLSHREFQETLGTDLSSKVRPLSEWKK